MVDVIKQLTTSWTGKDPITHKTPSCCRALGERNMSRKLFVLVIGGLLLAGQAQAQTRDNELTGIKDINLLIEGFSDNAKECQMTEELIRDAVMNTTSRARFVMNEKNKPLAPTMYFNVTTLLLNQRELCVSNVRMQLWVYQTVPLRASGQSIIAKIELWSAGYMRSSTRSTHGRSVREAVEGGTKEFITQWNTANK